MAFTFGIIAASGLGDPYGFFGGSQNSTDGSVGQTLTIYAPVYVDATTQTFPDDGGSDLTEGLTIDGVNYRAGDEVEANYEIIFRNPETGYYHRVTGIWIDGDYVGVSVSQAWNATTGQYVTGPGSFVDPGDVLVAIDGDDLDGTPNIGQFATDSNYVGALGNDAWLTSANGTPICFRAGTRIATPEGPRAVETIRPGMQVLTLDHGAQEVIWAGSRRYGLWAQRLVPKLRPVRIAAGALGAGLPEHDLWLSQPHRLVLRSAIAARMFGGPEVLVAAGRLLGCGGVDCPAPTAPVRYVHLLLRRHEALLAEGLAVESLLPGPRARDILAPAQRAEIARLTEGLPAYVPVRPEVAPQRVAGLLRRHAANGKALCALAPGRLRSAAGLRPGTAA